MQFDVTAVSFSVNPIGNKLFSGSQTVLQKYYERVYIYFFFSIESLTNVSKKSLKQHKLSSLQSENRRPLYLAKVSFLCSSSHLPVSIAAMKIPTILYNHLLNNVYIYKNSILVTFQLTRQNIDWLYHLGCNIE